MDYKNLSASLPDQRHAGWFVGLCSATWYMLLYQQAAGLGLLLFTIILVGFRGFLRKRLHWMDFLPIGVALSSCITATGWHWVLWITSWAAVMGKDLIPRQIPVHLHMASGFQKALLSVHSLYDHADQYSGVSLKKWRSWAKMAIIPMVITIIFFIIYLAASPAFSDKWTGVLDSISLFLQNFKFLGLFSLLLGGTIGTWILIQPKSWPVDWTFPMISNDVKRKQHPSGISSLSSGLRTEYRTGYLVLLSVNTLLAFYHFIDIPWMWFEFGESLGSSVSYSQLVHEGTYLLIASILLSMGIMLYFFRGNLNFFSKSASLRNLCYLWIAQNALLVVSVAIRNYRYIDFDGLTFKRIGVIIFLGLCLFGLATLVYKIVNKKSLNFIVGKNMGFALVLGIILAAAPWSRWITRHNLAHYHETGRIDWNYLIRMDGTNLDLLWEYQADMPDLYQLTGETRSMLSDLEEQDWRSWNLTRQHANKRLRENPNPGELRKILHPIVSTTTVKP